MTRKFLILPICAIILLAIAGCQKQAAQTDITNQNLPPVPALTNGTAIIEPTTLTYYISNEDKTKYCNGGDMDSEGYRKTITQKITEPGTGINLTGLELIRETLIAADVKAGMTEVTGIDQDIIRIKNKTAYLKPVDGWAGVSIFLCTWKPFVEVNLLQFPEIKKVVWLNDMAEWENLK